MKTKKLTELALLTTVALIIFTIELKIPNPIPIPGVKLGLANIVTIYAVYRYRPSETLSVVLIRIFLGALFGGNFSALLYSLAGGLLCLAGMISLSKAIPERYIWLCSVFGAVLHNVGQIAAAILISGTLSVIAYLPFLLISSCAAGIFTGITAQLIVNKIGKIKLGR